MVVSILALSGAIYTLKFITPMYESYTKLILVQTGTSTDSYAQISNSITTTDITLNSKLVDDYREIATSKSVLNTVIDELHLDYDYDELKSKTSVSAESDTEVIRITITYPNPEDACTIANKVAEVFIKKVEELYNVQNVHVLDKAEVEYEPSNIHLAKNIVIFAFVGGVLVAGYILLVNMLDTTVKTDTDIEKNLGVPVLASIVLSDDSKRKNKNIKIAPSGDESVHFSGVSHSLYSSTDSKENKDRRNRR